MSRRLLGITAVAALSAAALTITASPASAIVNGTPASEDQYANVGSLLLTIPADPPFTVQACTGTVIAPTVVLTASHCLVGFPPDFTISFTLDRVIDADQDGLVDDTVNAMSVTAHAHPLFESGGMNNLYDVGVLVLDEPVSVTPASLPGLGVLDSKAAKAATYTAVGYGTLRTSKTGGPNSFGNGWRREYAAQTVNSITKSWITFSMNPSTGNGGTCYGDSGGPHFAADGTVVAVTVTGDTPCRSTDKTYRIDTADALDFLAPFLTL
jgi:secreted trypsin-like serine protease